ncbi:phosphatidylglycerophosphatase [Wolbachia endosymbiont of Ctenocephalides felis wCfeT]|uniref:phosphatidylglycerophosphatase n=1 Tax=Wolbachia endosymbiont of Ctenocephalides felis wCfeT TaxID=2732593 RepID=UPI0014451B7E|nr:phosphatidylglycerophosphatase [Wolbachia endosymbiont of Ctenocephalides felis wCfeT]
MESFSIIIGKVFGKVFPAKIVSSFLGIGYLPVWQNYWSSFFILFVTGTILMFTYGAEFLLYQTPTSSIVVASIFIKLSIIIIILQLIGIFIVHAQDPGASSSENIVVHLASGQALTVAFSMPAILYIYNTISKFYKTICKGILMCPLWFNDFMHCVFLIMIPYVFFNVVEAIRPWPLNTLQLGYNNAVSITFEGVFHMFYAAILLYLTAFIFCDLTMHDAIILNKAITQYIQESSADLSYYLHNIIKK